MLVILWLLALIEVALHAGLAVPAIVVPAASCGAWLRSRRHLGCRVGCSTKYPMHLPLGSTLNIAAFNLGNAAAAWIGAQALELGMPLSGLPLLSAGLALAAVTLLVILGRGGSRAN